ncbi:helix-turn-helix transcriptional regulator [Marinobacterium aestuariivivens]|uniref:Helix-turn-helix transcriptional regulator n=1 Tax=Marinobacterium aestuariivivens TaxID=1698799 RepID=A0ABW2A3M1_9GAMM
MEAVPWETFLNELRTLVNAQYGSLILRSPSLEDTGLTINVGPTSTEASSAYSDHFYALDPFVGLPRNKMVTIQEFLSLEDWTKSEFYLQFLAPVDVLHIMGADLKTRDGVETRLRLCRTRDQDDFGEREKAICSLLLSHLERSIQLHHRLNRMESERNVYAGAVDQLAVGTIILDEKGLVMETNQVANNLIKALDGIKLTNGILQVGTNEDTAELKRMVSRTLSAQRRAEPTVVEALRVSRPSGRTDLGIIVRSVPSMQWSEGKACPAAVIFISDPEQEAQAPQEVVKQLFGLTPAEASLAMLLANGLTLDEASEELEISRNTARAHLRSIFSKTGVTRQTMLVRLILKSVASLG